MDVQVDEVGAHGRPILEPAPEDTLEPAQEGGSRRFEGEPGSEATLQGSSRDRDPLPRIPILRLQETQVPAAQDDVVLQPADVAPVGVQERLVTRLRERSAREPFLDTSGRRHAGPLENDAVLRGGHLRLL